MSQIRGKDTRPEIKVRKYLFSKGLRFRKNDRRFPGCPDIVLPKYRTVVFVNGCFWHGHAGCRYFVWPRTNELFWHNKIMTNIERDLRCTEQIKQSNWRVFTVWECELKPQVAEKTLSDLYSSIVNL